MSSGGKVQNVRKVTPKAQKIIEALRNSPKGQLSYATNIHKSPELLKPLLQPSSSISVPIHVIKEHQRASCISKDNKDGSASFRRDEDVQGLLNTSDQSPRTLDTPPSHYRTRKQITPQPEEKSSDPESPETSESATEDNSTTDDEMNISLARMLTLNTDYNKQAVLITDYEQESRKLAKEHGRSVHEAASEQVREIYLRSEEKLRQAQQRCRQLQIQAYDEAVAAAQTTSPASEIDSQLRNLNIQRIKSIRQRAELSREEREQREQLAKQRAAKREALLQQLERAVDHAEQSSQKAGDALKSCSSRARELLTNDPQPLVNAIEKCVGELRSYSDRLQRSDSVVSEETLQPLHRAEQMIEQHVLTVTQLIAKAEDAKDKEEADRKEAEALAAEAEKQKQAAEAAQADAAKSAAVAPQPTVSQTGSVSSTATSGSGEGCRKEFERLMSVLEQTQKACENLMKQPQHKILKNNLQKAINIAVNSISRQSGSHVLDKLNRLTSIALGRKIQISNTELSASAHPQGTLFCTALIAKKLVKQGEDQVSASSDSAYPIAAVVLGLWVQVPQFGDLFLAYMYKSSPYLVPYFPSKKADMSTTDYYKLLGYNVDSQGEVEPHDKFLKRLSGLTQLQAALLMSPVPRGISPQQRPPQLLTGSWRLLSVVASLTPRPDISATLLYETLSIAGSLLLKTYNKQAVKLLDSVAERFTQAGAAADGPTSRLVGLLTEWKTTSNIPPPSAALTSTFWAT